MQLPSPDSEQPLVPPVLVAGMHNSGTSMLAAILHYNGIFMEANIDHYESHFFSYCINDNFILGSQDAWKQLPLMPVEDVMAFYYDVRKFINSYWRVDYTQWGYNGVSAWGFKDPRLCILLPVYLKLYPDAKVLFIHRNPETVAKALAKKSKEGVGILPDEEHWRKLTLAYNSRVEEFGSKHKHFHRVSYEGFCAAPLRAARPMFEYLGLEMTDKAKRMVSSFVIQN